MLNRLACLALTVALLVPFAGACSSDSPPASTADAGVSATDASTPDAGPTYADGDWMFDADKLLDIKLEISQQNWDALRFQSRNVIKILGEECGDGPSYSPFTYVRAKVTIDGQVVDDIGVRKKGFLGSMSDTKPSLKLKFNKYLPEQRFSGWKRMTLNNSVQDPSFMNQCLGFKVFAAAGVPTPRCSFAKVSVNGTPLGIYVHVESVKKPFLATHFTDTSGNMYEGTLSDFRTGWTATYERKTNESVPPGSEDRSDIDAVVAAMAINDNDAMVAALGNVIDLDAFYTYWAVETLTAHWDGYGGNNNNHYIYADPATGKFTFLPWGTDQLFGDAGAPIGPARTRSIITRRLFLHAPTRQAYVERYRSILNNSWNEVALLAEVDRIEAMIRPEIPVDEIADFDMALADLRMALDGREQRMRASLNNATAGDAEQLMQPLCFAEAGALTVSFDSNYGGAANAISMNVVVNGITQPLFNLNVFIGPSEDKPDSSVMFIVADTSNNRRLIVLFSTPNDRISAGTVDLTDPGMEAVILFFPEGSEEADEVYFMSGDLVFTEASPTANAPWKGSATARLWNPPWF